MGTRDEVAVLNPRRRPRLVKAVALCAVVAVAAAVGWGATAHETAPGAVPESEAAAPTAGGAGPGDATGPAGSIPRKDMPEAAASQPAGSTSSPGNGGSTIGAPDLGQKVIRTATLSLTTKGHLDATLRRVNEILAGTQGYVASLSQTGGHAANTDTADLTLRVPAEHFSKVMDSLGGLGPVTGRSVTGDDVTGQSVDLDARLRALQAQADAFSALLTRATSITDVLAVREQLDGVLTQIEQLSAERKSLDDRVEMATIEVSLAEPGGAPAGPTPYWREVLEAAVTRVARVGAAVVVGLATLLLPGLLVGLGWLAWRRTRRHPNTGDVAPTANAA